MAADSSYSTPSTSSSSGVGGGGFGFQPAILSRIEQDQLLSILLLLPVDSILSFAMTCRRSRSLADSDTLWESICRRDWGHPSVDDIIKSTATTTAAVDSHQQRRLPWRWRDLYKQVLQSDRVSCLQLSNPLAPHHHPDACPRPRASHSLNFVSGFLVLFGGGSDGGCHLDDTWITYIGNGVRRVLSWQRVTSGVPSGRFGHSCVVISDCLVLFGGINDSGIRQNDTWIGRMALDETYNITLSWRLLDVGPVAPPARGAHAGCSIDNRKMLIHGGIGLSGLRLGDTWVLDLSENLCLGNWHEIVTHPMPPARSGHTLTYIGGSKTVLFGGRGLGYQVLNDIWYFDTSEGHLKWVPVLFELQNIPEGRGMFLPRVGHSATRILGGRLLIYGGEDTYRNRKDDFWVLDISSRLSAKMQPIAPNQGVRLPAIWRRLKSEGNQPNCRSFHRACSDQSGRFVYVFGGMVNGVLQPAVSSGLTFDGELFLIEPVLSL